MASLQAYTSHGIQYYRIVESFRNKGKPSIRVLARTASVETGPFRDARSGTEIGEERRQQAQRREKCAEAIDLVDARRVCELAHERGPDAGRAERKAEEEAGDETHASGKEGRAGE